MTCTYLTNIKSFECTSCYSGYVLDTSRKGQCRTDCSNTQYFSWEANSCLSCANGQYMDPNLKSCFGCPVNCATCGYNFDTKVVECQTCITGSTFDSTRKLCKLNCGSGTYYDWGTNTCKSCDKGSFQYPGAEQC
jgi:hypothetical protein